VSNFIYDNTDLDHDKLDLNGLPSGANPHQYVVATDWNAVAHACLDLRDGFKNGKYHGFQEQASDPLPSGVTNYMWMATSGLIYVKKGVATPYALVPSTRAVLAGSGMSGGGSLANDVTLSMESLDPSPAGSYNKASITVDDYGRVISASSGGGSGYDSMVNDGVGVTPRTTLNVDGTTLIFEDDPTNLRTNLRLGATTKTLAQAYSDGGAGPQLIQLDSTRLGIVIKDASTPITGLLFAIRSDGVGQPDPVGATTPAFYIENSAVSNGSDQQNSPLSVMQGTTWNGSASTPIAIATQMGTWYDSGSGIPGGELSFVGRLGTGDYTYLGGLGWWGVIGDINSHYFSVDGYLEATTMVIAHGQLRSGEDLFFLRDTQVDHTIYPDQNVEAATGGFLCVRGGQGGLCSSTDPGGIGGILYLYAGRGGDGSATQAAGAGGETIIKGGEAGGALAGGGGLGGNLTLVGGLGTGGLAHGAINVGAYNTKFMRMYTPLNFSDGATWAVGEVGTASLRYDDTAGSQRLQVSLNGGAYEDILTGAYSKHVGAYETWYDLALGIKNLNLAYSVAGTTISIDPWTSGDHDGGNLWIKAGAALSTSGGKTRGGALTLEAQDGKGAWREGGSLHIKSGSGTYPGTLIIDVGVAYGESGSIDSFADYSGTVTGAVLATTTDPHFMAELTSYTITISGGTPYDGTYADCVKVGDNSFYFLASWSTTASGSWSFTPTGGVMEIGSGASSIHIGGGFTNCGIMFGGDKLGFFWQDPPVAKQISGADLTNNVTSGGTTDEITNWTDLTTYATDAAAIRNAIYQLSRKLKQVNDGLRAYGLFT
jgi:hypothetical protein